ncbi:MAG: hypothetical protein HY785_09725 [Oscillatoriophycideae cyanobacterium NC_groundwater_1537_Pr4_S-0.65um_50_18]|nr:hypothetical protein [Oscillatoriophycideae cyanobacterium NC_groundwater_1537_Pr4_S-0.65um_50_18]
MNYVIAVLADRIQAEAAYSALEKAGLPLAQISILGKGYKSADEFGFIDPQKPARKQALMMSTWVVPLGFIGGLAFNLATNYQLVPSVGTFGNRLLGGVFGAIAGAMGSFVVGGGVGLSAGSGDALPYRNRLNEGKYLVIVQGAPNITNQATRILRECAPESVQAYVDPTQI